MRIDLHPDALREIEDSAAWYRDRSELAGKGFALAVEAALKKIVDDPDRFPRIGRHCRACTLQDYPFQVIYRRNADRLFIVAVAHAKRRAGYWRGRSTDAS